MTKPLFTGQTAITEEVLNVIAHLPTRSLTAVATPEFFKKLSDSDFMRLAVLLAQKGYDEGGCPIGGVVVSNDSRQILGKGHNTLVQESHPYNHGETSAIRCRKRSAVCRACSSSRLGNSTANSSPPKRAMRSVGRR